jgi:hypothetical protein
MPRVRSWLALRRSRHRPASSETRARRPMSWRHCTHWLYVPFKRTAVKTDAAASAGTDSRASRRCWPNTPWPRRDLVQTSGAPSPVGRSEKLVRGRQPGHLSLSAPRSLQGAVGRGGGGILRCRTSPPNRRQTSTCLRGSREGQAHAMRRRDRRYQLRHARATSETNSRHSDQAVRAASGAAVLVRDLVGLPWDLSRRDRGPHADPTSPQPQAMVT